MESFCISCGYKVRATDASANGFMACLEVIIIVHL